MSNVSEIYNILINTGYNRGIDNNIFLREIHKDNNHPIVENEYQSILQHIRKMNKQLFENNPITHNKNEYQEAFASKPQEVIELMRSLIMPMNSSTLLIMHHFHRKNGSVKENSSIK